MLKKKPPKTPKRICASSIFLEKATAACDKERPIAPRQSSKFLGAPLGAPTGSSLFWEHGGSGSTDFQEWELPLYSQFCSQFSKIKNIGFFLEKNCFETVIVINKIYKFTDFSMKRFNINLVFISMTLKKTG